MGENAIWYNTEMNIWIIGLVENLGSNTGKYIAKNKFGGLTDSENEWMFFNDGWKVAPPNDITVQSTCKYRLNFGEN